MGLIKAITLWQPWATLVAIGAKCIETRSWRTKHRGLLAIHAAKRFTHQVVETEPFVGALADVTQFPLGTIVAVCNLADCVQVTENNRPGEPELSFGDYTLGRWMWILEDVIAFDPLLARGRQGLWTWNVADDDWRRIFDDR